PPGHRRRRRRPRHSPPPDGHAPVEHNAARRAPRAPGHRDVVAQQRGRPRGALLRPRHAQDGPLHARPPPAVRLLRRPRRRPPPHRQVARRPERRPARRPRAHLRVR
ncbi:hypothetical protein BN1708_019968, partial [Verticillium longisporum]